MKSRSSLKAANKARGLTMDAVHKIAFLTALASVLNASAKILDQLRHLWGR